MSGFKEKGFGDRLSAAEQARKANLERFRKRPPADDPAVLAQAAARQAIHLAREARIAERKAAQEAEAARQAAEQAAREEREYQERRAREEALEAERKAARDARYAARKARK